MTTEYGYDKDQSVVSLMTAKKDGTLIAQNTYVYDENGNQIQKTEKGIKTTYDYDSLNQIKMVVYDEKVTEQFDYDAVGNRIKRTLQGKEENYYYNNKNQLLQIDKENDTIFYKYDNQGNTLEQTSSKGTTTYQYDIYNRTRQVTTENGDTIKNKYDPLGFRYKKEVNGETHKYIFDGWSITAETNKYDELKSRKVRGYGLVKKETNDKQYYYHQNEHGDITHLTNTESEVENYYQYDVFGNIREQQENVENIFKYAGEQLDNETEQYYLRARFYNPVIARFTQEDVYKGDGLNLYVYVVNNPLLWTDPSGHAKKCKANKANNDTDIQTETNIISPSPEQLLGIKHANMQNPREALGKPVKKVQRIANQREIEILTSEQQQMANEILDDISAYYFLNDQNAYNRLQQNNLHSLKYDYAGWESVYIDVGGKRGGENRARIIFKQINNGTIKWQVKIFH